MTDEKEYGSLGRLAPEWDGDGRERNLTADDIYERFFGWVEYSRSRRVSGRAYS